MSYEKQRRLVSKLLQLTPSGEIAWQHCPVGDGFQVSFKDNSVRIQVVETGESALYVIDLINDHGDVVETITGDELDEDDAFYEGNVKLGNLYEQAKRFALGSDKVLNEILKDLDDIIPF